MSNTRVASIGAGIGAIVAILVASGLPTIATSLFAMAAGAVMAVALFGK